MTHYSITPAGTVAIGNLTPVGQNSGQVGCRWPPNGHHLAACLQFNEGQSCQLRGPFWYRGGEDIYVPLPLPIYRLEEPPLENTIPQAIYSFQWRDGRWQVLPEHQGKTIEQIGGQYLIRGTSLRNLYESGAIRSVESGELHPLPWQTLTLSHNRREDYQVREEGGFFAEMTTLLAPGWSILVEIIGDYEPPEWSSIGAGGTPARITRVDDLDDAWLYRSVEEPAGAVLLTGALWSKPEEMLSVPHPPVPLKGYAAETGEPWQSWTQVPHREDRGRKVRVLTPGEWMTPAGAVYLWPEGEAPIQESQPYRDPYKRHVLGYGHLWLFGSSATG
ncbi:MAG: hypothetical protein SVX43_02255 [Cyanobacteriota bacterium]|nr:hypothetical protein [Cyanobacteriota bacterium]